MNYKNVSLIIVYLIIFLFSVFSIVQIRYFLYTEGSTDETGSFNFLFFRTPELSHQKFVLIKISLFVITALLSFVLMLSEYFLYNHPEVEERIMNKTHKEIKKMIDER